MKLYKDLKSNFLVKKYLFFNRLGCGLSHHECYTLATSCSDDGTCNMNVEK